MNMHTGDQLMDLSTGDKGVIASMSSDPGSKLPWGLANVWWHKAGEHQMWSMQGLREELASGNFINVTQILAKHGNITDVR